jgi:hypothetical protein
MLIGTPGGIPPSKNVIDNRYCPVRVSVYMAMNASLLVESADTAAEVI